VLWWREEVQVIVAALIGFLFGFVASMPIAGPIGALVFARALQGRTREGFQIAVGAAVAEAVYVGLAFWGYAELLRRYHWLEPVSNGVAAVILFVLGVLFIRHQGADAPVETAKPGAPGAGFFVGFTIMGLNPTLLATWTAASAALLSSGLVTLGPSHAIPFSLGALVGIVLWFATLLRLVTQFRDRFSYATLARVIRTMGWVLLCISAWFVWRLVT
jgi:threonine/homoserine/homoserine lactone efflux protein